MGCSSNMYELRILTLEFVQMQSTDKNVLLYVVEKQFIESVHDIQVLDTPKRNGNELGKGQ